MEKKNNEIAKDPIGVSDEKKITRKEAIKKTGYIAASAATMMVLLSNPEKAKGCSTSPTGSGKNYSGRNYGGGNHGGGNHGGGNKKSTGSSFAGDSWHQ